MRKYLSYSSAFASGIILAAGIMMWGASLKERSKRDLTRYYAVTSYIDANHNGKTEMSEWAIVYEKLGIEFDPLNPRALTASDLEKFLIKVNSFNSAPKGEIRK